MFDPVDDPRASGDVETADAEIGDVEDARLDRLYARLETDLQEERGIRAWMRSRPTPLRVLILVAVAASAATMAMVAMERSGPWESGGGGWIPAVAGLGAMAVFALLATLQPIYVPRWGGVSRAILFGGIALGALLAVVPAGDGTLGALGSGRCLLLGSVVAMPVFAVAFVLDRAPRRGAIFAALTAGLVGALTVQMACPGPAPLVHLAVEHFGVVLLASGLLGGAGYGLARLAR